MARQAGSKNKRTRYREARETMAKHGALIDKAVANGMTAFDYIGESLVCMGEALKFFVEYAREEKDMKKKRDLYRDVLIAAEKLAPFRYPKYATVKVATDDSNKVLVGDDVTYQEVLADLAEHIRTTGVWPTKMMDTLKTVQLPPSKPKPPPPRPPRPPPPPPAA